MGLAAFELRFASLSRRFKPLDIISGSILIQISGEAEKVDSLTLELSGKARTEFDDNHHTLFKGEEVVYSAVVEDVGSLVASGRLGIGSHVVSFNVLLPSDIPYSFEHKLGTIRYKAEARLGRSGLFKGDERRVEAFVVTQELDLNLRLENFLEVHCRDTTPIERACTGLVCCMGEAGEAEVSFRIPHRGYVPGDVVHVSGYVHNNSRVKLKELSLSLEQCVVFLAGDTFQERRSKKDILASRGFLLGVPSRQTKFLSQLSFRLPHDLQWLTNSHCSIIQVSYRLRILMDNAYGWYKLPIVIGSQALHSDPIPPAP